jgi:hypothetical protein
MNKEPETQERLYSRLLKQPVRQVALLIEQTKEAERLITLILWKVSKGVPRHPLIDMNELRRPNKGREANHEGWIESLGQNSKRITLSETHLLN